MRQLAVVATLVAALSVGTALAQTTRNASTRANAGGQAAGGEVQTQAMPLGTVHLPRPVKADDQPLKAGTYQIRLTGEAVKPAVGETPNLEQWVEFLQGGKVRGKAVASIIPPDQVKDVAKGPRPKIGGNRVDLLKGNDYVRVWINKGGNNYLIHLPVNAG